MTDSERSSHANVLTPREQEVLALLREGLTNPQIAERLGITLDGAKFHVSEILSRLGVSSREEAARWEPSNPPWWTGGIAPVGWLWRKSHVSLLGTAVAGGVAVAVVAGFGLLVWGLLQTNGGANAGDGSDEVTLLQTNGGANASDGSDEVLLCMLCAPDLEMRVGDAVLTGRPGASLTYTIERTEGSSTTFGDAFGAGIHTPAVAGRAPLGVDGVIELPDGFTGTQTHVAVYEVLPVGAGTPRDGCPGRSAHRVSGIWYPCLGELSVVTSLGELSVVTGRELDESLSRSEFSVPLSDLVSEPGEYVITLSAEIFDGPQSWGSDFGFYIEVVG